MGVNEEVLRLPLTDQLVYDPGGPTLVLPDFNVFHRHAAMFPWRSHALWFITQMYRWGQVERPQKLIAAADRGYRPALYRQVAAELGWSYPLIDDKPEGLNARGWTLAQAAPAPLPMGADRFFDASRFDPAGPVAYLQSFAVANLRAPLDVLEKMNRLPPAGAADDGSPAGPPQRVPDAAASSAMRPGRRTPTSTTSSSFPPRPRTAATDRLETVRSRCSHTVRAEPVKHVLSDPSGGDEEPTPSFIRRPA